MMKISEPTKLVLANVKYFYNSLLGYSDQAPPPYPGPHVSENKQQTMAPYPPTLGAAAPYPPAASPYPSTQDQSVPYPPPVVASAPQAGP